MTLRQRLAEAKIALRAAKDTLKTAETVATLGVTGKNDDERKRNTAIALHDDRPYTLALTHVRVCEATLERAEADVAEQDYELRLREVAAREEFTKALRGKRSDDAAADTALSDRQRRMIRDGTLIQHADGTLEMPRGFEIPDTTEWFGR